MADFDSSALADKYIDRSLNDLLIRLHQLHEAEMAFMGNKIGRKMNGRKEVNCTVRSVRSEVHMIEQAITTKAKSFVE